MVNFWQSLLTLNIWGLYILKRVMTVKEKQIHQPRGEFGNGLKKKKKHVDLIGNIEQSVKGKISSCRNLTTPVKSNCFSRDVSGRMEPAKVRNSLKRKEKRRENCLYCLRFFVILCWGPTGPTLPTGATGYSQLVQRAGLIFTGGVSKGFNCGVVLVLWVPGDGAASWAAPCLGMGEHMAELQK